MEESRISLRSALISRADGKRAPTLQEEGVCIERDTKRRKRAEDEQQRRDEEGRKNGDDLLQDRRYEEKEE
ncbi:hypothetical protein NDU88_002391 [Pleurodeles waltl]|uniref:Uncharacterized protein n=1 Tax=Pleurodeles waltl TaxID=8319 RepID=A0AAV7P9V0_PLEWA|nr:hypothetical protein NDU88_002391 [Pleurodeles waltl]